MLTKARELFVNIGLTFCIAIALTLCPVPGFAVHRLLALAGGLVVAEIIIWYAMRKLYKQQRGAIK
jgi:hypothetical protein